VTSFSAGTTGKRFPRIWTIFSIGRRRQGTKEKTEKDFFLKRNIFIGFPVRFPTAQMSEFPLF